MRHLSLVALSCTLACGDSGRAESDSASAATQPTSVSQSASDGSSGLTDASSASATTGVPTTSGASGDASTSTGAAATTSGETSGAASLGTTTVDPSLGTSGFQTSGFDDCEKALQATIRDFKTDHPDFEDFSSDTGLKNLVQPTLVVDPNELVQRLACLARCAPIVQVDVIILNGAPEPLGENVVQGPPFAIHTQACSRSEYQFGELRACKLATLVGIPDLRRCLR